MYEDRVEAGQRLAKALSKFRRQTKTVILALPRGGVIVAAQVAIQLGLPLDLIVTRKIGSPHNPEFAIGAISQGGSIFLNPEVDPSDDRKYIQTQAKIEAREIQRRLKVYHLDQPAIAWEGQQIILIDDGVATGLTIRAALADLVKVRPKKIILALPVAPADFARSVRSEVDEIIILEQPSNFWAVGQFYQQFPPVSDREVIEAIKRVQNR